MPQILAVSLSMALLAVAIGASAFLLSLSWVVLSLRASVQEKALEVAQKEALRSTMPGGILEIANQESEQWARDEIRDEAVALHAILGDWEKVEIELRRRYPPLSPDEAAERAWSNAATGGQA